MTFERENFGPCGTVNKFKEVNMKKVAQISALGVLGVALLAGCASLVGGAIPPQTVDNFAGLNGTELESTDFVQELASTGNLAFTKTFNNMSVGDIPFGIQPNTISLALTFARVNRRGTCNAPATLAVEVRNLNVQLSQSGSQPANASFGSFTLNLQQSADGNYNVASVSSTPTVNIDNPILAFSIATAGAEPNTLTVSGRLRTTDDSIRGCRLALVIGSARATYSNFR